MSDKGNLNMGQPGSDRPKGQDSLALISGVEGKPVEALKLVIEQQPVDDLPPHQFYNGS